MRTITVRSNGYVGHWRGGQFVAVWREEKQDQHVPDAMISVPESLNRTHATHDDIERVLREGMELL